MKKTFAYIISTLLATAFCLAADNDKSQKKRGEIEIEAKANYLFVPMNGREDYRNISLIESESGKIIAKYKALLSFQPAAEGWDAEIDISPYNGKKLVFKFEPKGDEEPHLRQGDMPKIRDFANDRGRPAFHYTAKNGWLNAPNGLVFFKGKWHLFHQHNPFSMNWQHGMHWAHAVSDDLVKWDYKPIAVYPKFDASGRADEAFSGSAYYDKDNKSGLFPKKGGGVVFAYTSTGRGDCLMISDDMVNFKELDGNPIIQARGRDPRIFFNEDSGLWTIVRYEEAGTGKNLRKFFAIYVSKDLKKWEKTDEFAEGFYESPEFVKMMVSGRDEYKWVAMDASGNYLVGDFDGRKFSQISQKPLRVFYGANYSTQFWNNAPDGRVLATSWLRVPGDLLRDVGQSFSQGMTLPWELRLVSLVGGEYQLRASIPHEIASRIAPYGENAVGFGEGEMTFQNNIFELPDAHGNSYVLQGEFDVSQCETLRLEVGTSIFSIMPSAGKYFIARLKGETWEYLAQYPERSGILYLTIFVDKYSAEVLVNSGEAVLFAGDAFLNPEQKIKIGSKGFLTIKDFYKYGFYRESAKERLQKNRKIMEKLVEKK